MADDLPKFGDVVGPDKALPSFDEVISRPIKSEGFTGYVRHLSKEVSEAFSHATGPSIGLDPESEKTLQDLGILNDVKKGKFAIDGGMVDGLVRPAAAALDIFMGGFAGGFKLYQEGLSEGGRRLEGSAFDTASKQLTGMGTAKLGKDLAAIPESIGSLVPGHGVRTGAQIKRPLLREARANGVLGTEAEYRGIEMPPMKVEVGPDMTPAPRVDVGLPPVDVVAAKPELPRVFERVRDDLVTAGRPADEAEAYASMMAARYETRAARLGTTAEDLFERRGVDIERGVKRSDLELAQPSDVLEQRLFREDAKGAFTQRPGERNLISLMGDANASTFGHESGHQFLFEMFEDVRHPNATQDMVDDLNRALDWMGVRDKDKFDKITAAKHEKFARGFESYLREGKAPTPELQGIFDRFREWLIKIYESVRGLRVKLNDDVRGVFDRLLAINPEARVAGAADALAREEGSAVGRQLKEAGAPPATRAAEPSVAPPASGAAEIARPGLVEPAPRPAVHDTPTSAAEAVAAGDPHRTVPTSDPKRVDKAGNIRLDNLNTPEDVNAVLREAADANGDFMEARRGVLSDAEVLALSDASGIDAAKLNKRKIGETYNAEQIIQARKLLIQSATNVRDLAKRIATGVIKEEDALAYAEAKARHFMIQEQVAGLTAEAGRALRAFRSLEGMEEAKSIGAFLQEKTGRTLFQLQEEARLLSQLDTPAKQAKFLENSKKPKFIDYTLEYWVNAILSGPITHVTNIMSNELVNRYHLPEQALTAAIGRARSAITGSKERAYLGEVKAALYSDLQGATDGLKAAWEVIKNEDAIIGGRQVEAHKRAFKGALGEAIRTPGRALNAEDQFFKARAYAQSFAEQAYRQAMDAGLKGKEFDREVARLRNSPTPKMIEEAHKFGDYNTFTNRLGERGKALQLFLARTPVLKFIAPFVQTPLNILKYGAERSIVAPLFKQVRAELKGEHGAIARDRAVAKITLGTAVQGAAVSLVLNEMITGAAPADERERAMWYESGKQPYSIRIGDNWYSYQRIEPLSTFFGVVADLKQVYEHLDDDEMTNVVKLIAASVTNNVLNKTWLQGPSEAVKAMSEPERYGTRWINRFATSFIPNIVAQPAQMMDPYIREARTIVDAAKARIPGMSGQILPRNSIWGEPIERDQNLGYILPTKVSHESNDPVTREFLRLGIFPGPLRREIVGQKLTDQEYDDYTRIAGRTAKVALDEFASSAYFDQIPDHIKGRQMLRIVDRARHHARTVMKYQYPHIIFDAMHDKMEEAAGR